MPEPIVYRPHQEAPARATFSARTPGQTSDRHVRDFEFVSRGDFVAGRLVLPETAAPHPAPLVLLTLARGQAASLERVEFAPEWLLRGFALAMIDLPLHGRRSSPKLSQRLLDGIERLTNGEILDLDTRALVEEFARQSTSDLIRASEALAALPEIDSNRVGLMGVGLGAITSAYAFAHDSRICSAVLALGAMQISEPGLDPSLQFSARRADPASAALIQMLGLKDLDQSSIATSLAHKLYEAVPMFKERITFPVSPVSGRGSGDAKDHCQLDDSPPAEAIQSALQFFTKHLHC